MFLTGFKGFKIADTRNFLKREITKFQRVTCLVRESLNYFSSCLEMLNMLKFTYDQRFVELD